MTGWLDGAYLWVKAAHVILVIFWMAGMLMLPRFFAYHAQAAADSEEDLVWRERERRLLRIIVNPSMVLAWIFGLMLATHLGFEGGWLHVKLVLVLVLSAFHGMLARWRKDFARGENRHSDRFYRLMNEIPSVIIILVVILVIVKPF
ncbi:MAG: protoporphyrinogen oxidase HemJ [Alphaproteobacteria bacterium]|nr:MAG: protoporphyrinogen oxidase HemJ [Alphaproteobacteria bacterium]